MMRKIKKMVPKWYAELVVTLTKLYDVGYENAWKDREKLK